MLMPSISLISTRGLGDVMAETYFEGTRWLQEKASEQKFLHFRGGVAVYEVVNPEYMEWLEARVKAQDEVIGDMAEALAEFENDETRTRRELALRRRQLEGIGDRCLALLKTDDRFMYLDQLPAEWYALRDAIAITGGVPDGGMKAEALDLLESSWEALDE